MQILLMSLGVAIAIAATVTASSRERSALVLVRAVIDGDTIDVTMFGRVRALCTREASSRSAVLKTPVMAPRTRSRRTSARVSIPSTPRMLCSFR